MRRRPAGAIAADIVAQVFWRRCQHLGVAMTDSSVPTKNKPPCDIPRHYYACDHDGPQRRCACGRWACVDCGAHPEYWSHI